MREMVFVTLGGREGLVRQLGELQQGSQGAPGKQNHFESRPLNNLSTPYA